VEQELPNLPEHLRTSPVFSAVRSVDFSFLCLPFKFVPFLLIITYFLNLASCSEHFISIKHRILATFNINKKKINLSDCMPLMVYIVFVM
jgi:hypothetical protein